MFNNSNLLQIEKLSTHFFVRGHVAKAVDEVDLSIARGKTLGLVGESGCGKSVTAHSIIGLIHDFPGTHDFTQSGLPGGRPGGRGY
jgi:ABC-type dipeptide/oligopeptide/nickel transport system ATPase component